MRLKQTRERTLFIVVLILGSFRFPFEIHLVHYKSKYGNLSHALQGNGQDREAVMVLAVLAEVGHDTTNSFNLELSVRLSL